MKEISIKTKQSQLEETKSAIGKGRKEGWKGRDSDGSIILRKFQSE